MTDFRRIVSDKEFEKSLVGVLPIISHPPKYDACKYYFNGLNKLNDTLQLTKFFGHAGKEVYSQIGSNYWKHNNVNKKIFVIIGYFHQVCVRQKMFKRRKYLKHNDSFVDSSVIAPGSVEKASSGYHYY